MAARWTMKLERQWFPFMAPFRRLLFNRLEGVVVNSGRFKFIAHAATSFIALAFSLYLSKPTWLLPGFLAGFFYIGHSLRVVRGRRH